MPPKGKAVWLKPQAKVEAVDIGSIAAKASAPAPRPQSAAQGQQQLRHFVVKSIRESNLLGLGDAEVESTAELLLEAKEREELFSWANTLMLPEAFAEEIIRRREALQATAVAEVNDAASVATTAKTTASRKAKKGAKGRALADDATGGLVEGALFECGCFATQHDFRSNCLNCGRIFCMQECDEACYGCGLDPTECLAYEVKVENGRIDAAAAVKNKQQYEAAMDRRDKLLSFANERAKRTLIIDDQSGQYATNVWMTKEERAEVEAAAIERRKVEELHKRSGAYTVHLDIVNQNAMLGAVSLPDPAKEKEAEDPETKAATAAAIANSARFGGDDAGDGMPPLLGVVPQGVADDTASDSDDDDDAAVEGGARVLPLPSLLNQIFYGDGSGAEVTAVKRSEAAADPKKPAFAQRSQVAGKATVQRESVSRRVQIDYYEDDRVTWRLAQQRAARSADTDDERVAPEPTGRRVDPVLEAPPAARPDADEHSTEAAPTDAAATAAAAHAKLVRQLRNKDQGMCLSMHQPWASLLIAGIKTHEGRVWPSDFRGRLWIHAAAAKPSHPEEIECKYQPFLPEGAKFPTHYPTSCLLGYVAMVDCLDRDQYAARYAPEERQEDSEHKFICEAPTPLPFLLSMDGKHKIFKLDKKMWLAARKQLGEKPPQ